MDWNGSDWIMMMDLSIKVIDLEDTMKLFKSCFQVARLITVTAQKSVWSQ